MLTEKERDWKNNNELTEGQKQFLRGAEWICDDLITSGAQLWLDDQDTGIEVVDSMLCDVANALVKNLKEYIGYNMDDMIESMLKSNFVDEGL